MGAGSKQSSKGETLLQRGGKLLKQDGQKSGGNAELDDGKKKEKKN